MTHEEMYSVVVAMYNQGLPQSQVYKYFIDVSTRYFRWENGNWYFRYIPKYIARPDIAIHSIKQEYRPLMTQCLLDYNIEYNMQHDI